MQVTACYKREQLYEENVGEIVTDNNEHIYTSERFNRKSEVIVCTQHDERT